MTPDKILATYEAVAPMWDKQRDRSLFEKPWLDRMMDYAPGRRVLDLGCGAGNPIARYLCDHHAQLTGVDGAKAMIALFEKNVPEARAMHADMRDLDLQEKFDAILAWNSYFHLDAMDQAAMFPVFRRHAAPGAVLMFTSGPEKGTAIGEVAGEPVYHASLSPDEYNDLLELHGFDVHHFVPEDPECCSHTIWLAKFTP